MEIWAGSYTGRSFGGGPVAFVSTHLTLRSPEFGHALNEIDFELWYPWRRTAEPASERGHLSEHAARLTKLPKRRFERKRGILRIEWLARHMLGKDIEEIYLPQMTTRHFDAAFDDFIEGVEFGLTGLKQSDDVDSPGLLEWLRQVRSEDRGDDETLRAMLTDELEQWQKRRAEMDPWAALGLDWDRFHADARTILDDLRDWGQSDDFAPHGNDTGADMMADWSRVSRCSPAAVARNWGIDADNPEADEYGWWHWVQIHLALAFGHIKKRAACPPDLARATRAVIARERELAAGRTGWPHRDDWLGRLERYDRILARFAE